MLKLKRLVIAVAFVLIGAALGVYLGGSHGPDVQIASQIGGGLSLSRPAFAQSATRSFLEDEAGISVYAKIDQVIDLSRAQNMYNVIEDVTGDYIIGTIKLLSYDETWWPHVWIRKDGWIVVYYNKAEPTSKLMHWDGYRDGRITSTTLREALLSVGRELGLSISSLEEGLTYYHWQHPDAGRLLLVVGARAFRYTIPSSITVRDASWSFRAQSVKQAYSGGTSVDLVVDGTSIVRVSVPSGQTVTTTLTGDLDGRYLTPGDAHQITWTRGGNYGSGSQWAALVFVHK